MFDLNKFAFIFPTTILESINFVTKSDNDTKDYTLLIKLAWSVGFYTGIACLLDLVENMILRFKDRELNEYDLCLQEKELR